MQRDGRQGRSSVVADEVRWIPTNNTTFKEIYYLEE